MNKKNLPIKQPANATDKIQSAESEVRLSNAQLLSVIEFSRQFPELTQHLATVLEHHDEEKQANTPSNINEQLEFPPLVVPDLRGIKPRLPDTDSAPKNDEAEPEDEFALFAAGRLPPPEPAGKQDNQKKKKKIWKFLLPLTLFLFFLLWLHEVEFRSIQ